MTDNSVSQQFYAVVPAAGMGRRMQSELPKQYLQLLGKTVLEHTLSKLLAQPQLQKIVVVVQANDQLWQSLDIFKNTRIEVVEGGVERCHSVLNGVQFLAKHGAASDWVLVHDVARPCISSVDIQALISTLNEHPVGGILAVPVTDTIKQVAAVISSQQVAQPVITQTVDRSELWQAQTPQMFRLQILLDVLAQGIEQNRTITDEASALEMAGYKPAIVEAIKPNIKITRPEDLSLAEYYLQQEGSL